jgi:hypothetical protein
MIEPLNGIKLSFAIPTVFSDELSFSEFLGKVQAKLNEVIAEQNTLGETVKDLSATVTQNKTETDAKISNIEITITANKQDADSKITALTATVAANKQDADGKITALQTKTTPRSLIFRTGANGYILFSKNEDELYTGLTFTTNTENIPNLVTLGIYNMSFSDKGNPLSYTPVKVSTFTSEIITPGGEKAPGISAGMLIVNPNKSQKLYLDELETGDFMSFGGDITLSTAVQATSSTIANETVWIFEISVRSGITYLKTLIKPTETAINPYRIQLGAAADSILTVYGNKISLGSDPNTNIKRADIYSTNDTNISIVSTASNNTGQISIAGENPKIVFPISGINGSSLALVPEFEISITRIYDV